MDLNIKSGLNLNKSCDKDVLCNNDRGAEFNYIQDKKPKKQAKNPTLDSLATLLANNTNVKPEKLDKEESAVFGELTDIDAALTDIESEVNALGDFDQSDIEALQDLIEKLKALEAALNKIEQQLQEIAAERKER